MSTLRKRMRRRVGPNSCTRSVPRSWHYSLKPQAGVLDQNAGRASYQLRRCRAKRRLVLAPVECVTACAGCLKNWQNVVHLSRNCDLAAENMQKNLDAASIVQTIKRSELVREWPG